jgi:shikimate 5-dehydrogenase
MLDRLQLPAPTRTLPTTPEAVTMVAVNRIEVLNSRERNSKIFNEIVENIRYLAKLLGNEAVKTFIERQEPEILMHFEMVVNTVSMEEAVQQQQSSDVEPVPATAST